MANPALNEKTFAPERLRTIDLGRTGPISGEPGVTEPATGAEAWRDRMTLDGVVLRGLILFPILLATGWFGWQAVKVDQTELGTAVSAPGWLMPMLIGSLVVGFVIALVTIFKPRVSPYTAPAYAAVEGFVLGVISHFYNARFEGIALQAVLLTAGVFVVMLGLYSKRIIKVDDRLRRGIFAATGAVMIVYLISMVMRLFGTEVPLIHEASPFGILFSLVVVGIASANLLLDFDLIEKGVQNGAPKWMEWYAAFGLLVTLVWLYLELLRLLSKLRSR